jgi:protein SOK2
MSYPTAPGYDSSRSMYSAAPPQQTQYNTHSQMPLDYQRSVYPQTDMAQPSRPVDHGDSKPPESMLQQGNDPNSQPVEQAEGEHEQENEYTHTSSSYNNPSRHYTYATNGTSAPIHSEHIPPDMTSSPHQNASGRQTPRTTTTGGQGQWNTSYANAQRSSGASNSMSYILGPQSGNPANGNTQSGNYQPSGAVNQYSSQGYSTPNGVNNSGKRSRDGDEQDTFNRPDSVQGDDMDRLKRRKTMEGGAVGAPTFANPNNGLQRARTALSGQGM